MADPTPDEIEKVMRELGLDPRVIKDMEGGRSESGENVISYADTELEKADFEGATQLIKALDLNDSVRQKYRAQRRERDLLQVLQKADAINRMGELSGEDNARLVDILMEESRWAGSIGDYRDRGMHTTLIRRIENYEATQRVPVAPPAPVSAGNPDDDVILPQDELDRRLRKMDDSPEPAAPLVILDADQAKDLEAALAASREPAPAPRAAARADDATADYRLQVGEHAQALGFAGFYQVIDEMLEDDPRKLADILGRLNRFNQAARERDRPSPDALVRIAECLFYNKPVSRLASEHTGEYGQEFYDEIARGMSMVEQADAIPAIFDRERRGTIATLVDIASPVWRAPARGIANTYRRIRNSYRSWKDRRAARREIEERELQEVFREIRSRGGEDELHRALQIYNEREERMDRRRAIRRALYVVAGLGAAYVAGRMMAGSGKPKLEEKVSSAPDASSETAPAAKPATTPASTPSAATSEPKTWTFAPEPMHEWRYEGKVYRFPQSMISKDELYDRAQDLMRKYDAESLSRKLEEASRADKGEGIISQKSLDLLK